jgi:integrase
VATLYKRGETYYLNWRQDGLQVRRSIGKIDRSQAEAIRAEKAAEVAGVIAPRSGRTVEAVLGEYVEWSKSARPASHKGTRAALRPLRELFGHWPTEGLDMTLVERWAAASPQAPATVAKSIKMARAAYRRAIRLGTANGNPFLNATLPKAVHSKAPPFYSRDDMAKLYACPRGPIWRFMANTGLRRTEMAKATRRDIREGMLYVESTATGRTKSGRWRWVPLNGAALDALASLGDDRLVTCHRDTLGDWFAIDARAAGLPGSLHWLRHTFCTHLAQAGESLHQIKQLAGHSSVQVTEMYAHHLPGAGGMAVAKLDL